MRTTFILSIVLEIPLSGHVLGMVLVSGYLTTMVLADLQLQVSAYTVLRKFTETWILPLPKVQVELDLSLRYNLRRVGQRVPRYLYRGTEVLLYM